MTSSVPTRSPRRRVDRALAAAAKIAAVLAGMLPVLLVGFLVLESWPAFQQVGPWRLATGSRWHPADGEFGLAAMLVGTALTTFLALALAAPLGLATAIFARHFAPPILAAWLRRFLGLLAAVPSVVFGLWGLVAVVPILARFGGSGQNLLAAGIVLALMILPTITLTADAALAAVPDPLLRGAAALGLGRWSTAVRVALPAARGGIAAGLLLALARGAGETIAVVMVAGNVVRIPGDPFSPVRTLTANVALEMGYAEGVHRAALFASGLLLLLAVGCLLLVVTRQGGRRAT